MFFSVMAILTLFYWISMLVDSTKGLALIRPLPKTNKNLEKAPLVSIIVAAKEEEESIRETVKHLLNQTYQRIELIVINDRSQDNTGVRLEELKRWAQKRQEIHIPIQVIHITSLPSGWLGKNHALYQGYLQAKGEYLLFTDADIHYSSRTIQDALHYVLQHEVDHLTITPSMQANSFWLRSFVHQFLFSFGLFMKPWRANIDRQHKHGIGIGAFNLISRKAYDKIGTHRAIAMRPDDDLQLGIKVKQAGLKQRIVTGLEHLSVEWYPTLDSAIKGLEKNTFAGLHYSLVMVCLAVFGQFFALFFPYIAIWIFWDWRSILYLLSCVIMIYLYFLYIKKLTTYFGYEVIAFPVTVLLFIYMLLRSTYYTLKQGGVYWRGTFYSLQELRNQKDS